MWGPAVPTEQLRLPAMEDEVLGRWPCVWGFLGSPSGAVLGRADAYAGHPSLQGHAVAQLWERNNSGRGLRQQASLREALAIGQSP